MEQQQKERKPDSDFLFRIVGGDEGRRLTWHSLECATGKNARYAKRTAYASPEARREAIKANNVAKGYHGSFGNDMDYSKRTYHVPSGMCGFAWVGIRPGNSSLARQAKKLGIGGSAYGGGVSIWIHEHGQSYECKQKHAHAYARVLSEHGVDAYAQSRLD